MHGLMQDWPLTVDKTLEHARIMYPKREVVTRTVAGPIKRTTYSEIYDRAKQVSDALLEDGIKLGDRVATLAWNTSDHMETWFGAMGIGAVLHTVNPRLFPEQLVYIINHAEDRVLFFDTTFLPLVEAIAPHLATVERYVIYCAPDAMPDTKLRGAISYELYVDGRGTSTPWGEFSEETACGLCYTSGTTGNPKGVLYSHRSNVLHTLIGMQSDCLASSNRDVILPVVPMFHANAWGLTFAGPASGAKIVMPGARMDGAAIYELLDTEKVNMTAAVPTVWLMLLNYLEETGKELPYLERVVIGGSAVPEHILRTFEEKYGVTVAHAWGMTEMSPLGTTGSLPLELTTASFDEQVAYKLKQGRVPFGVEMKVVDDTGALLPRDGKSAGRVLVRGPAVAREYFKKEGGEILDGDGWFDTGDVAHLDAIGTMQITDRAKDVIKSGGEWISSIDLENVAVGHPKLANAAAIGVYHPKWDERPLLVCQPKLGESVTREDILDFMNGKVAKSSSWMTSRSAQRARSTS